MIPLLHYVLFSSALLLIGGYGVVRNRNAIVVLMSIEIMLTAANVNFVAFAEFWHDMAGHCLLYTSDAADE